MSIQSCSPLYPSQFQFRRLKPQQHLQIVFLLWVFISSFSNFFRKSYLVHDTLEGFLKKKSILWKFIGFEMRLDCSGRLCLFVIIVWPLCDWNKYFGIWTKWPAAEWNWWFYGGHFFFFPINWKIIGCKNRKLYCVMEGCQMRYPTTHRKSLSLPFFRHDDHWSD